MGLFGRLLSATSRWETARGKQSHWPENWAVFPGESGDNFAMFYVDLGAVRVAPVSRLPIRLDIEVRFAAREDGMPADGHLPSVQRFEEIVAAEARDRRGAYVGRMITDGACRYTCYLPDPPTRPPALPRDDFAPTMSTAVDDGWAYLRDVLAPDADQWHIIRDMTVVRALLDHGDQLDRPRPIDYEAHFADRSGAEAAAVELRLDGFGVDVGATRSSDFRLAAVRADAVEPPRLHKVTWLVREVVERHGGTYDGWGCLIVTGG